MSFSSISVIGNALRLRLMRRQGLRDLARSGAVRGNQYKLTHERLSFFFLAACIQTATGSFG
jgi:hypothetical protein